MGTRFKGELLLGVGGIVILIVLYISQVFGLGSFYTSQPKNYVQTIGVPLDDVYIHCQYAKNLLAGHGYSFNVPQEVTADTSPLWVLLLAAGGFFSSHIEVVAVLLSALCWLLIAPGTYRFARYALGLSYGWSLTAGLLMLGNARLLMMALSGMETTLAVLLGLMAMEMHIYSRQKNTLRLREAFIIGLAIATRPEFYLFALILIIDWIYAKAKQAITTESLISYLSIIAGFVLAVLGLPFSLEGRLTYHSSIVQGAALRLTPDAFYFAKSFYIIIECYILFFLYILIRKYSFKKSIFLAKLFPAILFIILLPLFQSFVAPQYRHFGRYVFIAFPFVVLWLVGVLSDITERDKQQAIIQPKWQRIFFIIAWVPLLILDGRWIALYGQAVDNINDQHLAVADWLTHHASASDVIAADDVGAIGYFTGRPVLDLTGLVSPEFYPLQHDQKEVWKAARAHGASLFIIYTRLNPEFYSYAKDSLELIKDFRVSGPLISSADTTMGIYKVKGATVATY